MSEAEDRTQAPSKRRREMARAAGQVAQSRELTAAAGLLGASAVLAVFGEGLASAMLEVVRQATAEGVPVSAEPMEVVGRLRGMAVAVGLPLGVVLGAYGLAAFGAHQGQVRGLWTPSLIAPDPGRLWGPGGGSGFGARASRSVWSLAKGVVVVLVAARVIEGDLAGFGSLGGLDAPGLAAAAGRALRDLTLTLAGASLVLGLADFGVNHLRFESLLRVTADEQREDQKSAEGDPALRAQRRRLAKSWRGDPAEILAGASLVLTGPSGLTVVLAGGPLPRPVSVRSTLAGMQGTALKKAAGEAGLATVEAAGLARRIAQRRPPGLPLSGEMLGEIAGLWPAVHGDSSRTAARAAAPVSARGGKPGGG